MKTVALIGNPNSGKTTLFNALTGLRAKVGNYPGITVEHREGRLVRAGVDARVIDLPGTYSVVPRSEDEAVAVNGLLGELPTVGRPDLVVAVVDATSLERNLYLVAQLREWRLPLVVALTLMDTVEADGGKIDFELLSRRIGVPVVPVTAVRPGGADTLAGVIEQALASPSPAEPLAVTIPVPEVVRSLAAGPAHIPAETFGAWALAVHAGDGLDLLPILKPLHASLDPLPKQTVFVEAQAGARYARVRAWLDGAVTRPPEQAPSERRTSRIDDVVLHPIGGPLVLVAVFGVLFELLFAGADPLIRLIENTVGAVGSVASSLIPASLPLLRSLVADGIVAGAGNVIVFVPQIAMLFLFLGLLEDSGYLARAAFVLDRVMRRVGLHGRAFVPLLSGFACAVPAILATRTIENRRDRLVTILVAPLVSCSARLPVYGLMIATTFATVPPLFGFIHPGTLVMLAMYGLSMTAALAFAALFKRTILKGPPPPFVLELPQYRRPRLRHLLPHVWTRVRSFLFDAGTTILAITIVLWGLFNFPRPVDAEAELAVEEARIEANGADEEELTQARAHSAATRLEYSAGGRLGKVIEPVIAPLGFDWKMGVGIIASFAAREVFVSTLGLVYGLGDGTDEESVPLRDRMRADRRADGTPVHTPLTGLSLMVFFVLAMQCMSTMAAVKRETGTWKWPAFQFAYMTSLAWVAALLTFQIGHALGLG